MRPSTRHEEHVAHIAGLERLRVNGRSRSRERFQDKKQICIKIKKELSYRLAGRRKCKVCM